MTKPEKIIQEAWENRGLLKNETYIDAVKKVIKKVDEGKLRAAMPVGDGWEVNEWVKKAILLYFAIQQ
ncbi:MAG: 2,3,4,5-tetrahydropyridine-2,6-dicarboxylate N-succinyltransferase, partial [Ginsengibacter sp.]